jgi:hypothetical protein
MILLFLDDLADTDLTLTLIDRNSHALGPNSMPAAQIVEQAAADIAGQQLGSGIGQR